MSSLTSLSARGACPQCGKPTLFAGLLKFASRCPSCGLDFSAFNVGDGPAAFITTIVGTIITIGAVWLELAVAPPVWVHVLIWLPLAAGLVIGSLRLAKAALLIIEYRRSAHEGRKVD